MSARKDYIEVVPTSVSWMLTRPESRRPHFIRRVSGYNGLTMWDAQSYASRANAVRAARHAAQPEGLAVVVLDATGEVHRRIEPNLPDPMDSFRDPGSEGP